MKLWGGLQVMHLTHGFSLILLGRLVLYEGAPCSLWLEFKETNSRPSHGVWSWLITQIHPNSTLSHLVQEFKPLIFQDGKPVPFPEPTKACCLSFHWSFGCGCHFSIRRLEDRGWKSMLELDAVHQKLQTRSRHFFTSTNYAIICIVRWCWLQYTCILYYT